ncbi:MAG: DUF1289 domain-containing protein [Rhizobiales bacterium]|nr:DUF1289 domain-containing protein [Hyphomicrobiales bacterium]
MESPCVGICVLDERIGLCTGCGRSRMEIARWMDLSGSERSAIMAELPARLEANRHPERRVTRRRARGEQGI